MLFVFYFLHAYKIGQIIDKKKYEKVKIYIFSFRKLNLQQITFPKYLYIPFTIYHFVHSMVIEKKKLSLKIYFLFSQPSDTTRYIIPVVSSSIYTLVS